MKRWVLISLSLLVLIGLLGGCTPIKGQPLGLNESPELAPFSSEEEPLPPTTEEEEPPVQPEPVPVEEPLPPTTEEEPTPAPEEPTPAPVEPTPVPVEPTPAPEVPPAEEPPCEEELYIYSVKFLLGEAESEQEGVKPANYLTAVNIHNFLEESFTVRKKAVIAMPQGPRSTIEINLNTGFYQSTGTYIDYEDPDDDWEVIDFVGVTGSAPISAPPFDAIVVSEYVSNTKWGGPLTDSRWISTDAQARNAVRFGEVFIYAYEFNLPANVQDPVLDMTLMADQEAEVFLNGILIGEVDFWPVYGTQVTTDQHFVIGGLNTLTVVVKETYHAGVVTGLDVVGTVQAIDAQVSAYEEFIMGPNWAVDVDGADICNLLGLPFPPSSFIKGFVAIESPKPLNVVAVYTSSTSGVFGRGFSMDIEYISPTVLCLELAPTPEPDEPLSIILLPPTATNFAPDAARPPTTHTVTARVTYANSTPVVGINVTFSVTGANPQPSTTVITNNAGEASFTYYGMNAGTDTIIATEEVTGLSATATKVWTLSGG